MEIDLEAQTVTSSDGDVFHFELDAFKKHCLLNGLDDISLSLEKHPLSKAMKQRSPQNALGFRVRYHTISRLIQVVWAAFHLTVFFC